VAASAASIAAGSAMSTSGYAIAPATALTQAANFAASPEAFFTATRFERSFCATRSYVAALSAASFCAQAPASSVSSMSSA
jgi:hypothetical protein